MPDVLALPLARAKAILDACGREYLVVRISSAYRQEEKETSRMEEYVVRQTELSQHTLLLSTVMKRRKEVLKHGFQD